jgi:hypothetical protein
MIVINMILTVILLCFVINVSKYSEYFDNKCLFKPQCQMVIFVGYETLDETNF